VTAYPFFSEQWRNEFSSEVAAVYADARGTAAPQAIWVDSLEVTLEVRGASVYQCAIQFARDGEFKLHSTSERRLPVVSVDVETFREWAGVSLGDLAMSGRLYLEPTIEDPVGAIGTFNFLHIEEFVVPSGPFPNWPTFTIERHP
jgi:hypothetical protein